jgi:hypothetical protein
MKHDEGRLEVVRGWLKRVRDRGMGVTEGIQQRLDVSEVKFDA